MFLLHTWFAEITRACAGKGRTGTEQEPPPSSSPARSPPLTSRHQRQRDQRVVSAAQVLHTSAETTAD